MEKETVYGSGNFLGPLFKESQNYNLIEDIEKLLDNKKDFSKLPVQPLFTVFKSMSPEKVSTYLPQLSKKQRTAFLDLDFWNKDELDFESFDFWIKAYSSCEDDAVKTEFSKSSHFSLYLKSKFNIWTFDSEDPVYPEDDNYFLTEDNLLLFHFDDEFPFFEEVRSFVKELYSALGVEKAYIHLFKLVAETHSNLVEEEYHFKKERLRDLGFLDYFESLAMESTLFKVELIDSFILKKNALTGEIGLFSKCQTLPKNAIVSFGDPSTVIMMELGKVEDEKRRDFLKFNFIRLINSINTVKETLKSDSVSMASSGRKIRSLIDLGFSYVKNKRPKDSIFDIFEFEDLYKIGNSLVKINQKKLKDALKKFNMEEKESFLGPHFQDFLEGSFDNNLKFNGEKVVDLSIYNNWTLESGLLIEALPFILKFHQVHLEMISSGAIQDTYYLNYTKEEMDFEAILISCFANHLLGYFEDQKVKKLGISVPDAKSFFNKVLVEPGLDEKVERFLISFGLSEITGFSSYLNKILRDHLEGVDLNNLGPDDFKHVGGPIILNLQ